MLLRHDPGMDDDIFGSPSGGSAPEMPDAHPAQEQSSPGTMDDVWGADSAPGSPRLSSLGGAESQHVHPSDVRRLQQEHATAGYRDGITVAKATSIQAGFDEGFGLGATIGAQIGKLLGLLEGIAAALASEKNPAAATAQKLLDEARGELSVQSVFSPEYWDVDGTWKYKVRGADGDEADAAFADVASAHPLVRKWDAVVTTEIQRWGIDMNVLAAEEAEEGRQMPQEPEPSTREIKVASKTKEALAW